MFNKLLEIGVNVFRNDIGKWKGLNLSIETLDGLVKHNGPLNNLNLIENLKELKISKI